MVAVSLKAVDDLMETMRVRLHVSGLKRQLRICDDIDINQTREHGNRD